MATLLEVIVTSVEDAKEAEAGGADRLELVRDLRAGGLTPDTGLVAAVKEAVRVPVRAMLRQNSSMSAHGWDELETLKLLAKDFVSLGVDGLVAGFIKDGKVDSEALRIVLSLVPDCPVTFHRAFDEVTDPVAALEALKGIGQIDRILTIGGTGEWPQRKQRLHRWLHVARPIRLLVGAGLCPQVLSDLKDDLRLDEVHVGRAARLPQTHEGVVRREAVALLKSSLR